MAILSKKQEIDKKEYKIQRLCEWLQIHPGEIISPTTLGKTIGKDKSTHKNTINDVADMYDSLKDVGFTTIRDKNGKLLKIMSSPESLDTRKELRNLRKEIISLKDEIIELKDFIDEIKTILKTKKQ